MVFNFKKQYEIAKTMVGELNQDFVHHCYLRIVERIDVNRIKHPDTYFYAVMRSQIGVFMKLNNKQTYSHDIDLEFEPDVRLDYIEQHLNKLEKAGYLEEVWVFKQIALGESQTDLAKKLNITRKQIREICNFVKNNVIHELDINSISDIHS